MDHIKSYELIPLSVKLNKWVQRVMYQLQTGFFDGNPDRAGQYYLVGMKVRKLIRQMRDISKLLRKLELDVELGDLVEVSDPDHAMIGGGFVALAKAIYGDDFEFDTAMITVDKEGVIVTAFDREVGGHGSETD